VKLAIATELYYPSIGGQESRYLNLIPELTRVGVEVEVFTIRFAPDQLREETVQGTKVHRVFDCFDYRKTSWNRNPWGILGFTLALAKMSQQFRHFDFILFNKWPLLPPILLPWLWGRQRCLTDWCEVRRTPFWFTIYALLSQGASWHLCLNHDILEYLQQRWRVSKNHLLVLGAGINLATPASVLPQREDRHLLYLGRLSAHKRPDLLARTFLQYRLAEKGFRLTLAGDGPLRNQLETMCRGQTGIELLGKISEEEKIVLLNRASLFVLPSEREGFPQVFAEAAACGCPVLTTDDRDNGGASVVRRHQLGWVCSARMEDLATHLESHAVITPAWELASKEARCSSADFTLHSLSQRLNNFLQRIRPPRIV
jgi:glycosyltransferase involved in cell wall biosynthesis